MTQRVYLAKPDVNQYCVFVLSNERDAEALVDLQQGVISLESWKKLSIKVFEKPGETKKPVADVSCLSTIMLCSQQIHEKIFPFFKDSIIFFPFENGKDILWGMIAKKVIDCLNEEKSSVSRFSNGQIWDIQKYSFNNMVPLNACFFRVPQLVTGELLATEGAKRIFDERNISGMEFSLL